MPRILAAHPVPSNRPWACLAALCATVLVQGCTGTELVLVGGVATATSFAYTDKAPSEHVGDWVTGLDCGIIHLEEGKEYCIDPEAEAEMARQRMPPPVYCYKTIGSVECFATPDPRRQTQPLGIGTVQPAAM
jgi:hypothetical protein